MVPMNIQFRKLSDSRIRIYFLGMFDDLEIIVYNLLTI